MASDSKRVRYKVGMIATSSMRDWIKVIGFIISALSVTKLSVSYFSVQFNELVLRFIETYNSLIHTPVKKIFQFFRIEVTSEFIDCFILYLIVGGLVARTIRTVYPKGVRPLGGIWGKLIRIPGLKHLTLKNRLSYYWFYFFLIVLWPLVMIHYIVWKPFIVSRYVDHDGPDFEQQIGWFAVKKSNLSDAFPHLKIGRLNNKIDYEGKSDTWYAYNGSFRIIFFVQLCILIICIFLMFCFGLVPLDLFS